MENTKLRVAQLIEKNAYVPYVIDGAQNAVPLEDLMESEQIEEIKNDLNNLSLPERPGEAKTANTLHHFDLGWVNGKTIGELKQMMIDIIRNPSLPNNQTELSICFNWGANLTDDWEDNNATMGFGGGSWQFTFKSLKFYKDAFVEVVCVTSPNKKWFTLYKEYELSEPMYKIDMESNRQEAIRRAKSRPEVKYMHYGHMPLKARPYVHYFTSIIDVTEDGPTIGDEIKVPKVLKRTAKGEIVEDTDCFLCWRLIDSFLYDNDCWDKSENVVKEPPRAEEYPNLKDPRPYKVALKLKKKSDIYKDIDGNIIIRPVLCANEILGNCIEYPKRDIDINILDKILLKEGKSGIVIDERKYQAEKYRNKLAKKGDIYTLRKKYFSKLNLYSSYKLNYKNIIRIRVKQHNHKWGEWQYFRRYRNKETKKAFYSRFKGA